jgi:hypothetical protein
MLVRRLGRKGIEIVNVALSPLSEEARMLRRERIRNMLIGWIGGIGERRKRHADAQGIGGGKA